MFFDKESAMKKLLIIFGLLLLLGVAVEAFAQEILQEKVPIATAICRMDASYVLGKDKPLVRSCVLFVDPTTDDLLGYMLIYNEYGDKRQVIVEVDFANTENLKQKIVWRAGEVAL